MNEIEIALRKSLPDAAPAGLASDLADRAAAEGLLDVAYATVDSPLGGLLVAGTPRGLVRVAYTDYAEYFAGRRDGFDLPIDWSLTRGFAGNVLRQTARIPFGATSTYAEVATRAGSPRAVRAAGNALGANPLPVVVPCHRVLRTGGALGGYTGGVERKEFLLRLEGALT
jgi:methylated-DNA-[protein]-cysteine S-methyltransferase